MDPSEGHCSICLRPWTSIGPHQVCCLCCGHLFGYDCILKWLARASRCPMCNARARILDIRLLYADKVSAADEGELDNMRLEILNAQAARSVAESSAERIRISLRKATHQAATLRIRQDAYDISALLCAGCAVLDNITYITSLRLVMLKHAQHQHIRTKLKLLAGVNLPSVLYIKEAAEHDIIHTPQSSKSCKQGSSSRQTCFH